MVATKNAIQSKSESRTVDFKSKFDPGCAGDWCELVKDVVAIANSGGGSILIGVDDDGKCCGPAASTKLLCLDPAVITDKVAKVKKLGVRSQHLTFGSANSFLADRFPGVSLTERFDPGYDAAEKG
jgi:hypothetical protein